jgi:hypothetical protein
MVQEIRVFSTGRPLQGQGLQQHCNEFYQPNMYMESSHRQKVRARNRKECYDGRSTFDYPYLLSVESYKP